MQPPWREELAMRPTWWEELTAESGRDEVRGVIARLILEDLVRVEVMPGDGARVRVVPANPGRLMPRATLAGVEALLDEVCGGQSSWADCGGGSGGWAACSGSGHPDRPGTRDRDRPERRGVDGQPAG